MPFLNARNGEVYAIARQAVLNKKVPSDTIFFGRQGRFAAQLRTPLLLDHFMQKRSYLRHFLSGFLPLK